MGPRHDTQNDLHTNQVGERRQRGPHALVSTERPAWRSTVSPPSSAAASCWDRACIAAYADSVDDYLPRGALPRNLSTSTARRISKGAATIRTTRSQRNHRSVAAVL